MTSKERVKQAVSFTNPDRPPIDLPTFAPGIKKYQKELNLPTPQAVSEFFGADTIRLEPDYIGPQPNPNWGKKFIVRPDGFEYQLADGYPCKSLTAEEIRNFPSPPAQNADWYDYNGYTQKCEPYKDYAIFTSSFHLIMIDAWELIAPQDEALVMFYTEPERMHAALDRVNEFHIEYVTNLLSTNADVPEFVFFNDDLCSQQGPMISPELFDEFQLPRLRAISDIVHKYNRKMTLHCCGSIRKLLPNFIKAGVDVLHPIQPGLPGNDIFEIKKEFGKDIVLFSGLDMQEMMRSGKPQEIYDHIKRIADRFSEGGLIFNLFPMEDIPVENMLAFRSVFFDN